MDEAAEISSHSRNEIPVVFECADELLPGILHRAVGDPVDIGVLLVVGGPQYRVGSHRQFVLLARALASAGIATLRFDYRGMGDSTGSPRDFEDIAPDIRAALDCLYREVPSLRGVVSWGLCDAATANAFYAPTDPRMVGQIALNPWVRTQAGEAEAYIRHYYLDRFLSLAFWRKVLSLQFAPRDALKDFMGKWRQSRGAESSTAVADARPLPQRLRDAQCHFQGRTLMIFSGRDLTAQEYLDRVKESADWQAWVESPSVEVRRLDEADHTFSRAMWRDQVAEWSRDWILTLARQQD